MQRLAARYADELEAQFRTLSFFVEHAGEVGRTHEVFLRQIIKRFLPGRLRCGTGFIATPENVTRQQDIIIYDPHSLPLLMEIGDCLVVDAPAVAGTIEVKTVLGSQNAFSAELEKVADPGSRSMHSWFVGLYAWEALSLDLALECYWARFREASKIDNPPPLPDVVYVRGKYLIAPNYDGHIETGPLLLMRLGPGHCDEGAGLLTLVERMWLSGLQHHAEWPWWVRAWHREINKKLEQVPWPEDLRTSVDKWLAENKKTGLTWPKARQFG